MYHAIVRANVLKLFEALNHADIDYVVGGVASRFEHIFAGDHTLGGTRHTKPAIRRWFERTRSSALPTEGLSADQPRPNLLAVK